MDFADVAAFVAKIEGPYKWYVIVAVISLLTAIITRVVFKTLKWFFLMVALGIVVFAIIGYLQQYI
ncbi:MAG: hypothetical protein WD972_00985 [Candidatus Andersenbacteria bacterium]